MAKQDQLLSVIDSGTISLSLNFMLEETATAAGASDRAHYALDLLAEWDITLEQLLHGAFKGLQTAAGIPAEKQLSLSAALQPDAPQLLPDGLTVQRTDSREPACETPLQCTPVRPASEQEAVTASLAVMLEALRGFYAQPLPADREQELRSPAFGRPRQPHIDAGFVRQGELTDPAAPVCLADGLQLWLHAGHGEKTLRQLGLVSGSSIHFYCGKNGEEPHIVASEALNPAFADQFPLYKISETPVYVFSEQKFTVNPAGDPPKKSTGSLLGLLSPLLMMAVMLAVRVGTGGSGSFLTYGLMSVVTLLTAVIGMLVRAAAFKKQLAEWKQRYEAYIERTVTYIRGRKEQDEQLLNRLFPPVCSASPAARKVWSKKEDEQSCPGSLLEKAAAVSGEIFSRSASHPQFLSVRIGTTVPGSQLVENTLPIEGAKSNPVFAAIGYKNLECRKNAPFRIVMPEQKGSRDGYLTDLPADIAARFRWLDNAPVHVELAKDSCFGVVLPEPLAFEPFLADMIFQLAFWHSPEQLQLICLLPSGDYVQQQRRMELFKHLPHFHELFEGLAQNAFSAEEAAAVMDRLDKLLEERSRAKAAALPHVVVLVEEAFNFDNHPLSRRLPAPSADGKQPENGGVSFVFFKRHADHLPAFCQRTLLAQPAAADPGDDPAGYRFYLVPHTRTLGTNAPVGYQPQVQPYTLEAAQERYAFRPDRAAQKEQLGAGFRMLSALYYYRVAQSGSIPKTVSLYDVLGLQPGEQELAGRDAAQLRCLMEEKLCSFIKENWGSHDPDVSLRAPVGLRQAAKGPLDETAAVFLDLHTDGVHTACAGTTGSGKSELMLAWLLCLCMLYDPSQLNLVILDLKGGGFSERLKTLPHCVGSIDNLSGAGGENPLYLLSRFEQAVTAEIARREEAFKQAGVKDIIEYNAAADAGQRMPYLVLVIDEFTELLKITADTDVNFRGLIDALARTARSLGIRMAMVSQNVTAAMSEETRTNTHIYLALKMTDASVSRAMVGTEAAASPAMPGRGRCFLRTVNGRFDAFQSAYTGGSWLPNSQEPVRLSRLRRAGAHEPFYDSRTEGCAAADDTTQLQLAVRQITRCYEQALAEKRIAPPRPVCLPPLPAELLFPYDMCIPEMKGEPEHENL